jgi:hypothetical protein
MGEGWFYAVQGKRDEMRDKEGVVISIFVLVGVRREEGGRRREREEGGGRREDKIYQRAKSDKISNHS